MCIGYDPFKYADSWQSEEEFLEDLEMENTKKNDRMRNLCR